MKLKVLTFNIWAIGYVPYMKSPDRHERIRAIASHLANSNYDIVCLQEVWMEKDQTFIKEACQNVLPHSAVFYGGVIGSGTMILSKWPIVGTNFIKFSMNGFKHHLWYGDALAGSGCGLAQLHVGPPADPVLVNAYVSHFHAEYNRENDAYLADRSVQALEAGDWIEATSAEADAIIFCGDFNTEPGDLPYRILTDLNGLADAQEALGLDLATCFAKENTYRFVETQTPREIVIDHIMVKSSMFKTEVVEAARPLCNERVDVIGTSLSDHEALMAEVKFDLGGNLDEDDKEGKYGLVLKEATDVLSQELVSCFWWQLLHFGAFVAFLALFLALATWRPLFALASAFHLVLVSVYAERRCSLRSALQNLGYKKAKKTRSKRFPIKSGGGENNLVISQEET